MDNFQRERVVRMADRHAPGNPPDRKQQDDEPLRCPVCRCVTKDGDKCQECINADLEMKEDR
jgi:hypothetical protein